MMKNHVPVILVASCSLKSQNKKTQAVAEAAKNEMSLPELASGPISWQTELISTEIPRPETADNLLPSRSAEKTTDPSLPDKFVDESPRRHHGSQSFEAQNNLTNPDVTGNTFEMLLAYQVSSCVCCVGIGCKPKHDEKTLKAEFRPTVKGS